jgi:transposase
LGILEKLQDEIAQLEARMKKEFRTSRPLELLQTLPGVGFILSVVILLEMGDVNRFAGAPRLAAYSGTTPRVHASGGKVRYGETRSDVNRYLKWAFVEAANCVALNARRHPSRHVCRLYMKVGQHKGHQKAVGAMARHLAEAAYWILKKGEPYREPRKTLVSSTKG